MESQQKLIERIEAITRQVYKNYPELYTSVSEIPLRYRHQNRPPVNSDLKAYYDSLIQLLKKYIP